MTDWKTRQKELQKTLSGLDLPPEDRHTALTQILAHLSAERKSLASQPRSSARASGESALVQMSLLVARNINALRQAHPEVIKQSQPPPVAAKPPELAPPAPARSAPVAAVPPGPSLGSRFTSWVSRKAEAISSSASNVTASIKDALPSPKTALLQTSRFAGIAAVTLGLAAGLKGEAPFEKQTAKAPSAEPITSQPAKVTKTVLASVAVAAPIAHASTPPAAAHSAPVRRVDPKPAVQETVAAIASPAPEKKAKAGRLGRMDDLFHREDELETALDKMEQMPVDEAFSKAVLVESGDNQHDAKGRVVTSNKGATGAAQVLPSTAKLIAVGCTGKPLDQQRFRHDKAYNKNLGKCYYKSQYERYSENPILAALAYNMGYGNVDKHISKVGDPTKGEIGMVDFIKKIRIKETRHYVLHMLGKAGFIDLPKKGEAHTRVIRSTHQAEPASERRLEGSREDIPRLVPVFDEARLERSIHVIEEPAAAPAVAIPTEALQVMPEINTSGPALH